MFFNSLISFIYSLGAFSFHGFLCSFLGSHFNFFSDLYTPSQRLSSLSPFHSSPSSHTPNCASSSRKRSVSLNCAISSSLGSSSAHGAIPQHPRTPRGAFPGDPRSPLTGLAVMGVECTCFTSEGVSRRMRPAGEGRRGKRVGDWEEGKDSYLQLGEHAPIPLL